MRVLGSLRARVAVLVLAPAIPAALLVALLPWSARQSLLAQHPTLAASEGDALLGQELLAVAALAAVAIGAIWIAPRILASPPGEAPVAPATPSLTRGRTSSGRDREVPFASFSHDLRTPLTSIKAASTLLRDHEDDLGPGGRAELYETIREAADGLDRLIANSVQLSRSRAGELSPRRIPASIDEVASRAMERLRHRLRNHHVVLVIPEDLPEIAVDVVLLDQAVTNLLENAATFSPPGTEIALGIARRNGNLILRVEDRGPGIPSDQRERVFEPFVKLAGGGGAGLGLAISRAIAEAHGGRILIEDPPGGGTAVVLELPLDPITVRVPEPSSERAR